jgi:hypothetical protein
MRADLGIKVRRAIALGAALGVVAALMVAPGAGAAVKGAEFGDTCEGVAAPEGIFGAVFERSRTGSALPTAAPVSGVLTAWIAHMPALFPAEDVPPMTVRVVRVLGPGQVEVTAKAAREKLRPGENVFETRLPILAGEYLAFGSNEGGSIACAAPSEEEPNVRVSSGGIPVPVAQPGGKDSFEAIASPVPVSGVIEPDRDGDGFGDLTQDGCPQSPDYQGACPTLNFAPGYRVGDGAVRVKVRSSAAARVAVTGVLPGLGTSLGARKKIAPGRLSTFSLAIPPALDAKLRRLDSRRSLPIRLVARVAHVTGNVSTDRLTLHLPGRG